MSGLTFTRHTSEQAGAIRDTVATIYRDAYAKRIATGDPFVAEGEFMRRFDRYRAKPGLDLVIAWKDGEPCGQTWGWPLDERSGAAWWGGLSKEPEPGFCREDGKRTFALSEIMVRQRWTRQGIAHALHDELLTARPETRAILLVNPSNTTAYTAYTHWGWRKIAQLRPNLPHAPRFDVLLLPLPLTTPRI